MICLHISLTNTTKSTSSRIVDYGNGRENWLKNYVGRKGFQLKDKIIGDVECTLTECRDVGQNRDRWIALVLEYPFS